MVEKKRLQFKQRIHIEGRDLLGRIMVVDFLIERVVLNGASGSGINHRLTDGGK